MPTAAADESKFYQDLDKKIEADHEVNRAEYAKTKADGYAKPKAEDHSKFFTELDDAIQKGDQDKLKNMATPPAPLAQPGQPLSAEAKPRDMVEGQNETLLGDLGTALKIGAEISIPQQVLGFSQGVANSLAFGGSGKPNVITRALENNVFGPARQMFDDKRKIMEQDYTPETQDVKEKKWLGDSPIQTFADKGFVEGVKNLPGNIWSNPLDVARRGAIEATESMPSSLAMAGPTSLLAKKAGMLAIEKAIAAGVTDKAAIQAVGAAAAKNTAMIAGGAGEGAQGFGDAFNSSYTEAMATPIETLMQNPAFESALKETNNDLPMAERIKLATQSVAMQNATVAAGVAFGFDSVFGGLGDRYLGGAAMGAKGRVGSMIEGAVSETGTEFVQSGGEQWGSNLGTKMFTNKDQSLTEGVGEAAIGGAVSGGIMGVSMGGALHHDAAGINNNDEEALVRHKSAVNLKMANLSTRDLLTLRNSPEQLDKLGIFPDDVSSILEERYAELNLIRGTGGPLAKAATADGTAQNLHDQVILDREQKRLREQAEADKKFSDLLFAKYDPKAEGITEVAPTAQDYSDVDTLLQRTVDKRVNEIRGKLEGPSPAEQKELDTIAKNQGNPEALWSMYGYDRDAKATQYATQNKQQAVTDFRFTNTTFDFDNNLPATPQDNEHQDLEWARQTQAALLHNKKKNTPLTAQEKAWLEELRLYENPEAAATKGEATAQSLTPKPAAPKVVTRKIKNGSYVLHDPETGREPEVGGSRMADEYPNAIQARKAFRIRWDEAQQSEARASELTNSKGVIPDGQETSNAERQGQGETLLDEKPVTGEPTQAIEQAAGNSGEAVPASTGPELTPDGEARDFPGGTGLQFKVTENSKEDALKKGSFSVTIFNPQDAAGLGSVTAHGDTEQAAYDRAVEQLAPQHRPPASDVVVNTEGTNPVVVNESGVDDTQTPPDQSGQPENAEYYQWKRNAQGGQPFGNKQTITPLTQALFDEHVKPGGEAKDFSAYKAAHPDVTHISLVEKHDGTTSVEGTGTLEELRPSGKATMAGWIKNVKSFDSPEAKAHGTMADYEDAPASADTTDGQGDDKAPWQMTKAEWSDFVVKKHAADNQWLKNNGYSGEMKANSQAHFNSVKHAMEEGKPVPGHVLAEYPELQADTGQKTNPAGKSEADTPTSQDDSGTTPAENSDGFQSGLVPPAKNGVYHLKNGNYSRFEQGRGWFKQRKTVEEAASIPERDGFFSPQYRQMDSARWKDVQPTNVSPKADGPTIGGEKSDQEKNKAKLLENRRKKLTEQLANATTAEDRAEIQGKLDKLEQFVTKSDAEKIPPADDKTKPAEDKRKITIRELEGAIHLSLVNDQEIMAHANAISFLVSEPDFVEKVDPIIVAKINDLITLAESKAARDLYATMIVSGKPVLSKSFYESLHDRAAKNFMQRQKEANRNPAVYESAITTAVTENGYDSGTDEGREFKEGFDHALKGKTKSTLPQGKEASLKGYRAAEKWIKTDIGKNWYEGKKGDKQKSTGESLRRVWEQLKKGLDELTTTDMEKTWAQILKATVRADLFPVDVLGPNATPGARQWVESFRREIYSFADFFAVTATGFDQSKRKRSGSKSENAFLGSWTSNIGRFVERGVQTDEKRVEVTREIALEYQTKVAELAQAFEGAETLADIQKVLQQLFGGGESKKYYSSDFYLDRKQKLFTTGLSTLFPAELGGSDERYSTWGKLLATETVVPEGQNRKTPLTRPRLDSITRSGMEDTRKGRDITPEELKETFGFADITIGDYVTAQEAKDHLNYVYDALMSMADVFRAEPKHLSFGGNLHLSIGALGHGKAAAHFSPNHPTADGKAVPVINVTNTRGDGAVFHEFVHAIDLLTKDEALTKAINSLKSLLKKKPASPEFLMKKMRSFLVGGSRFTNFGRDSTPKSHARYALENYYKYPDKGGDTTKFANDAALLDAGSEKGYWTSDVEMFARGSEAWVYDFLFDGQKRDDYLISEWAKNGKVIPPTYRGTPYPQGEERARLNAMIGSLFKEIVWDTNGPRLKEDGEWKNGGPKSVAAKDYEAERQRILANFDTIADQIIAEHKLNEKDSQRAREDRAINDLLGAPESYGPEGFVPSAEAKVAKQVIDTVLLDGELGISEERLKGFNYGEEILSYMRRYYFLDYKRDKSQNSWWYTATDLGRSFKIEYESRVEASQSPAQETVSIPNEQTPGGKDTDIGEANINDTLTDDELEQLFDEVVAELEEEASEKPEQEPPGTKVEKQPWTAEDFEEFKNLVEKGRVILLADRSVGLPTIHDFPPTGTVHLGYGAFRTTTAEYEAIWDGGGEMLHTPSGKAYTIVDMVKGSLPFYDQEKVLAFINATIETRPEPTPKFSSGLKAGDIVTVRPHSALWHEVVNGKAKDNDIDGQKVTRVSRDINGYEYVELENGKKVKGEDVQNANEDPAWEAPKAPTPQKSKHGTPSLNDAQLATAKALAANMAKHGVEGIEEALKGLVGIFGGGPNRLNSFPSGFDEDAYKAAKPHFVASAKAFAKAGQSFKDFIRLFFRELVTMFGPGVRPYAVRFAKDYEADYGKVPGVNNDSTIKTDKNAADLPHVRLAGWVTDKLAARERFTWKELFDKADDSYNGTQGEGKYAVKDAYDAMELGINQYILSKGFGKGANQLEYNMSIRDSVETAEVLESIISNVPTQTKRTKEQEEFQQFSTPPHEAYLAAWVANITPADTMLEPSAGIGGLAIFAKMAGAKVIVNELSSRRMGLLSQLPFDGFYSENAEHLASILPQNITPTVIVMNPPFSSTAGRVDGQRDTMNGAKHVEQALKKLSPGGRLVVVVGQGMAEGAQNFIPWWNKIKAEYNVRANIGIDGKSYVKYGTTFGNQVIVIDKTGPTPLVAKVITGQVESPMAAFSLLSEIREDRKAPVERQDTPTPPSTGGGTGGGTRGPRTSPPKTPSKTDTPRDHTGESGGATDKSEIEVGTNGNQTRKELGNSTFEAYEPQKVKVEGAHPHNTDLVESAALAAVEPPDPTYTPNLPKEVIKQGLLSLPQLEAVIYAGQAFGQWLVNSVRRGFFLGDGTGVGKGRQISAVIMDSLRNGQKKAVWISVKNPLIEDAKRDFGEITGDVSLIFPQAGAYTPTDVIDPKKTGILFTAYSTIIGNSKDKDHITEKAARGEHLQRDRVLQIANWLGKDFDGVIAFDEAHAMGNLIATRGARGTKPATLTAKAGQDLRNLLPKAKILYVSATGATEVANLAYADRLGLWGEGTPFASVIEFINEMSRSVSAMELVAQNLKQMGLYLARSLSFNGIEYSRVEHELSNYQRENYDTMAEAWQIVLQNINEALVTTGVMGDDGKAKGGKSAGEIKGRIMGAFWGSHQRFFNQVITAGAMPSVLEQIDKDLADGKSVILQLTNTNAADQDRALAKMAGRAAVAGETDEDAIEEFDLTPREQLVELLMNAFPVQQYEEVVTGMDDHGNPVLGLAPVVDSNGKAVINQEAVDKRDELVTRIRKMSIPDAALQMLINHYGVDKISEITGRSRRVIFDENGKPKTEKRSKGAVPADAKAFIDGKKRILVFSQAGGTGFSFHADKRFKNTQQRVHYILQPGWSADKAVQGLGRSHRTNQVYAPIYRLVTTDVPAQKRFISSIARRLEQLGALTSGQRDTAGGSLFSAADNLESKYASLAVRSFFTNLVQHGGIGVNQDYANLPDDLLAQLGLGAILDRDGNLNESKIPAVTQFLNRMLSLRVDTQKQVFEIFANEIDIQEQFAKQNGTFDDGLQTIRHKGATVKQSAVVHEDKNTKGKAEYVEIEYKTDTIFYPFSEAARRVQGIGRTGTAGSHGWYSNKRSGRVVGMWSAGTRTLKDGRIVATYGEFRTSGISYVLETEVNADGLERLTEKDARTLWNAENEVRPEFQNHKIHMIVGGVLPIWNRFNNDKIDVTRIQTDDGRVFLGRKIHNNDLVATLENMNVKSSEAKMTGADIIKAVLAGSKVTMASGAQVFKAKVSGEDRVEFKPKGHLSRPQERLMEQSGVFTERIQYEERYFLPNTEKRGGEVMAALMASFNTNAVKVEGKNEAAAGSDIMASRSDTLWSGNTKEDIWSELAGGEFKSVVARLRDTRKIQTVQTTEELPEGAERSGLGGAYDWSTDTMYLVADSIETGRAESVLLHEAFHRAKVLGEMQPILGELSNMERLAKSGSEVAAWFIKAQEKAQIDKDTPQYLEEIGAYAVQQYKESPNSIQRWVDRMLAKVKALLIRALGLRIGKVDPQLLRAIAINGLKTTIKDSSKVDGFSYSRTTMPKAIPAKVTNLLDEGRELDIMALLAGKKYEAAVEQIKAKAAVVADPTAQNEFNFLGDLAARTERHLDTGGEVTFGKDSPIWKAVRQHGLQALTLRQIAQMYGDDVPQAKAYYEAARKIGAFSNQLMQQADKTVNEWLKLSKEESTAVSTVMLDATIEGVHPDKEKFDPRYNMKQAKAAIEKMLERMANLDPNSDDYGRMADVIADKKARIAKETRRWTEWNRQKGEYDKLTEGSKAIYQAVRAQYDSNLKELQTAISERVARQAPDEESKSAALLRLRQEFDRVIENGPYFPLARFGQYLVIASKQGDRVVKAFESAKEQEAYAAEMKALDYTAKMRISSEYSKDVDGISSKFAATVVTSIIESGIDMKEQDKLLDEINQLIAKSMPSLSHRTHFIHRNKVKGFSQDTIRAFAENTMHGAHHIAKMKYSDLLTSALDDLEKQMKEADDADTTKAGQVRNELTIRLEQILNPKTHPVTHALTSMGFLWNIGPSIASGMVNLLQTPMVAGPLMAARLGGWKATSAALAKATSDLMFSPWKLETGFSLLHSKSLTSAEKEMLGVLIADGTVDVTLAHELAQASNTDFLSMAGQSSKGMMLSRAMRLISYPFHVTEVANRQITALAAYRMAMAKHKEHTVAVNAARDITMDAHFDYSQINRARIMEGNARRVLLLFKQYSQQMTFLLARNLHQALKGESKEVKKQAQQVLLGVLGGHFLMSGIQGMPVVGVVGALVGILMRAFGDDKDWDWEVALRNLMADHMGKTGGEMAMMGPARAVLPGDISSRVSLGDMWLRPSDSTKEGRGAAEQWIQLFLGPIASNTVNMYAGASAIAEGNVWRGTEMMIPKALKDVMRSVRYAREGLTDMTGDNLIAKEDINTLEILSQFLGFTPRKVAEMYAGKSAIKNAETIMSRERQKVIREMVDAVNNGDRAAYDKAIERSQEFSTKHPGFRITAANVRDSLRTQARVRQQTKDGVYVTPKHAELREQGRFANLGD